MSDDEVAHFWDLRDEVDRASRRHAEVLAERDQLKADQMVTAEMEIDIRRLEGLLAGVFTALHPPDVPGLGRTVEAHELPQLVADLRAERNRLRRLADLGASYIFALEGQSETVAARARQAYETALRDEGDT